MSLGIFQMWKLLGYLPLGCCRTAMMARKGGLEQLGLAGVSQLAFLPGSSILPSQSWRSELRKPLYISMARK